MRAFARVRPLACLLCAMVCLTGSGCSPKEEIPELAPVTGKVTYEGRPLPNASVVFIPADPDAEKDATQIVRPVATTDEAGEYELTWNDHPGAPPGKYNVIIIALKEHSEDDDTEEKPPSLIPQDYGNPKTSGLNADVKAEEDNVINFPL